MSAAFGRYLRWLREDRCFTIDEVVALTERKVSHRGLCDLETGKTKKIDVAVIRALATAYYFSFHDLCSEAVGE